MKSKRTSAAMRRSILLLLLSLPVACSSEDGNGGTPELPSGSPSTPKGQTPAAHFVGNVVETMDSGSYTYVSLERDGEQVWAAGPHTSVTVGEEISINLDMKMENFESETLDRVFESIYFVSSFGSDQPKGGPVTSEDPHAGLSRSRSGAESAEIEPGSIEKPDGGYRVAELWARRAELVGAEVVVRGRVVKYNAGILGRNWLHLQDGSGSPDEGNHDLTVTAQTPSSVGDLVVVRGVVAIDRDFGAGYSYDLIIEDATVESEPQDL